MFLDYKLPLEPPVSKGPAVSLIYRNQQSTDCFLSGEGGARQAVRPHLHQAKSSAGTLALRLP